VKYGEQQEKLEESFGNGIEDSIFHALQNANLLDKNDFCKIYPPKRLYALIRESPDWIRTGIVHAREVQRVKIKAQIARAIQRMRKRSILFISH
jgi:hypothetical protein